MEDISSHKIPYKTIQHLQFEKLSNGNKNDSQLFSLLLRKLCIAQCTMHLHQKNSWKREAKIASVLNVKKRRREKKNRTFTKEKTKHFFHSITARTHNATKSQQIIEGWTLFSPTFTIHFHLFPFSFLFFIHFYKIKHDECRAIFVITEPLLMSHADDTTWPTATAPVNAL